MKCLTRSTIAFVFTLSMSLTLFTPNAEAQRRRGGGFLGAMDVLQREDAQAELKMSEDQIKKIGEIRSAIFQGEGRKIFSASAEERPKLMADLKKKVNEQLKTALKAEQYTRMKQLYVQRLGTRALADETIAADLKISDDQKAQITSAIETASEARSAIRFNNDLSSDERDAKTAAIEKARDDKVMSILSDEQRKSLEAKKGPVFVFSDQRTASAPKPNPPNTGSSTPTVTKTVTPTAGNTTVASGATQGDAVLSFGGSVKPGEPVKELTFNFRYAPWADVLEMFSAAAGLTLDLTVTPPGTFNYYDDKKYTPTQALDVINGYLLQKGYLIVQRDKFLVVLTFDNPIPPNLIPIVKVEDLPKRGKNELLTLHMKLDGITAQDAAAEVGELIGPHGKVIGLTRTNHLVITDTGGNLQRIHTLLSGVSVDAEKVLKKFPLEHIDVADAEILVRELFGLSTGATNVSAGSTSSRYGYSSSRYGSSSYRDPRSQSSNSSNSTDPNAKVHVATDERTNTLLVTASPDDMKIVEEAVNAIDVEGIEGARRSKEPYLEVYQLKTADAIEVSKTLNVLYPGMVINEDGRTRRMHIKATPQMHEEIAASIKRLDGEGGGVQVAVIPLGRLDSYTATASIQSLFINDVDAPIIQPHPTSNALILRGQVQQIEQVRTLLGQMDPEDRQRGNGGTIRTIPLGGRDAKEFANILEKMINGSGRAKIRQIVPAASGPIRNRRVPGMGDEATNAVPDFQIPEGFFNRNQPAKPAASDDKADDSADEKSDTSASRESRRQKFQAVFATYSPAKPAYEESASELVRNASQVSADETDATSANQGPAPAPERSPSSSSAAADIPNILLTIQNGNLVAMSPDTDALDALEDMVDSLAEVMPAKNQWTVFYLQSADATETATVLERIFPTSSVSTTSSSGGGGLLGELTGGLSSMGRGLMDMSGLDMLTSGPMTLRIIPDTRTNSLFVSGPPHLVDEVEDTLAILDASELPEQLRARAPRYIEVKSADVNEVAQMVRDVYKEEMEAPQQQRGGSGQNPLAAIMGGGGGRGGRGGASGGNAASRIKLTLAVDSRNSRLIVSASESLFRQVEEMVKEIDLASLTAVRTTRVIPLEHANTAILRQTLGTLMPRVRVSSSSTGGRSSSTPSSNPTPSTSSRPSQEQIQQLIQQRLGGGSGRPTGSSFGGSRGTSGFGGRPGGTTGRGGPGGSFGGGRGSGGRGGR